MNGPAEQEPTRTSENGIAFMRDGVEMVGWVVLEHASLHPVVGFDGGADSLWRRSWWERGAVDEDWKGGVRYVGRRCGKVIRFGW